jgi:hypothetical protein
MSFRYKHQPIPLPPDEQRRAMHQWCLDNFGSYHTTFVWKYSAYTWRFRFKKDYVAFLLRWA